MAKSFDELARRVMTPQSRARAERRTRELLAEMLLSEARKLAGRSQTDLAKALGIKQPTLSKLEGQDDMQISTLKKIVEALGGTVDIVAHFPQQTVHLTQFTKTSSKAQRSTASRKTRERHAA